MALRRFACLTLALATAACGADAAHDPPSSDKGVLYVWAGPRRTGNGLDAPPGNDVLVTFDLGQRRVIDVLDVGTANNEPHHLALCGDHLFTGGLFTGRVFVFDVAKARAPALMKVLEGSSAGLGVADDLHCMDDGSVLATMMGDPSGGSPGGVLPIAADLTLGVRLPKTPPPALNPHGIVVDAEGGRLITTDLLELASLTSDPVAPVVRHAIRIWDLAKLEITDTVDVCEGPMEADVLADAPGRPILVSCMVDGAIGLVSRTADGKYTYQGVLDLDGEESLEAMPGAIEVGQIEGQRTLWVALSGPGEVRRYDISDLAAPALRATATVGIGAHNMAFSSDGATGYVSDYTVQRLQLALGMSAPDYRVWKFDASSMKAEELINFGTSGTDPLLVGRLPLQPHGIGLREP